MSVSRLQVYNLAFHLEVPRLRRAILAIVGDLPEEQRKLIEILPEEGIRRLFLEVTQPPYNLDQKDAVLYPEIQRLQPILKAMDADKPRGDYLKLSPFHQGLICGWAGLDVPNLSPEVQLKWLTQQIPTLSEEVAMKIKDVLTM